MNLPSRFFTHRETGIVSKMVCSSRWLARSASSACFCSEMSWETPTRPTTLSASSRRGSLVSTRTWRTPSGMVMEISGTSTRVPSSSTCLSVSANRRCSAGEPMPASRKLAPRKSWDATRKLLDIALLTIT